MWTALLDSGASLTIVGKRALVKIAEVQKKNKTLGVPNGGSIDTTKTIALQIPHWPEKNERRFFSA